MPTGWVVWAEAGSLGGGVGGLSTLPHVHAARQKNAWLIFNSKKYDPLPDMIAQSVFKCSMDDPLPMCPTHHFSQDEITHYQILW